MPLCVYLYLSNILNARLLLIFTIQYFYLSENSEDFNPLSRAKTFQNKIIIQLNLTKAKKVYKINEKDVKEILMKHDLG